MFKKFVETSDTKVAKELRTHPELVKKIDLDKVYTNVNKYKDKDLKNETVKKDLKKDVKKNKDKGINPVDLISVLVVIGIVNLFSGDFGK